MVKMKELACPNCGASLNGDFSPNQQITCDNCDSVFLATELETPTAIICAGCKTVNPIEERYCSSCGDPLKTDCILCHEENPIGTVFCANCGAHLANAKAKRQKMQSDRKKYMTERNKVFEEKEKRQQAEKLEQLLDDLDEPENHELAIYQINMMGPDAIDALIYTMLNDHDPDARYGSARALGQICNAHEVKGLNKARATKALVKALSDDEAAVRYWSANALGKCKNKTAIEPLAELLNDNHEGVRTQAQRSLQKIGGEKAEKILADQNKKGLFGWLK